MRRTLALFLLALACLRPVAVRADDAPKALPLYKDAAAIEKLVPELSALIGKTGLSPAKSPLVRVITPAELEPILRKELEPQMRVLAAGGTPEQVGQVLDVSIQFYEKVLLCKYGFSTKTIYVMPDTFENLAGKVPGTKTLEPGFFRAVFLHELVHACDDAAFDLGKQVGAVRNLEELQALNAVIEGHAQLVAKRILEAEGNLSWFTELEKSMTATPPDMDETLKYIASIMVADANIYVEALHFFEVIAKRTPAPSFESILADLPKSLDPILIPERYGQPPAPVTLPLSAAAERFEKITHRDGWVSQSLSVSLARLRAGFNLLPAEDVNGILPGIVANKITMTASDADGQSRSLAGAIFEMGDDAFSKRMFELEEKLMRAKDAAMKQGMVKILSSTYEAPAVQGAEKTLLARKEVTAPGLSKPIVVQSLVVVKGRAVLEITSNNADVDAAQLASYAEAMLQALGQK